MHSEEAILQGALKLFAREGVAHVGTDEIATAAGVNRTTLYRRFGSKQAVVNAATAYETARVITQIETQLPQIPNSPDPSFDANWFEGIIEAALADLAEEHAEQHRILQAQIQAPAASHQELSESLGITVGQVRVGLHRARGRLNRAVRAQLRRYVSSQEELDEEIACMVQTLGAFPG